MTLHRTLLGLAVAGLLLAGAFSLGADQEERPAVEDQLRRLADRVAALEARMAALEQLRLPTPAPTRPPPAATIPPRWLPREFNGSYYYIVPLTGPPTNASHTAD